jgi:uncharacterized protein
MEEFVNAAFSDDEFDLLDAWLRKRRSGICEVVTLEGFLTALVIGPNTISPQLWLPKIWGKGKSQFKNLKELNHFAGLVMGLYNEIAVCFEQDAASFEPSFYERRFDDQMVVVVDEWSEGFIKGMRLDTEGWRPLKRERPDLLKPIELFGTRAGWRKLDKGGEAVMHATWSVRIAPAVRDIYAFWLPYRRAVQAMPESAVRH